MRWSRALTLQSIKDNGGLETLFFKKSPPFDVLNYLVGERTRSLTIYNIDENLFEKLQFLNTYQLKNLKLRGHPHNKIKSLEPLRNMHLKSLILFYFPEVKSLEPLREMNLENISLSIFSNVTCLRPLQQFYFKSLHLSNFPKIKSFNMLRELRPESLNLEYFDNVFSLEPLREMRPKNLSLKHLENISSFEPLREMHPVKYTIKFFPPIIIQTLQTLPWYKIE